MDVVNIREAARTRLEILVYWKWASNVPSMPIRNMPLYRYVDYNDVRVLCKRPR